MDDVLAGSLMSAPVRTVSPDTTVQQAAQVMLDHDISSVVVVDDDNHVAGIFTSTDCVRISAAADSTAETTVEGYMSTEVTTTTATEPVTDVAETMMARGVHHVPVSDDTEGVVGMITTKDLAAYLSGTWTPSPETADPA
jgi:CBS domain-containing protein